MNPNKYLIKSFSPLLALLLSPQIAVKSKAVVGIPANDRNQAIRGV
jgi:hypothetical protein